MIVQSHSRCWQQEPGEDCRPAFPPWLLELCEARWPPRESGGPSTVEAEAEEEVVSTGKERLTAAATGTEVA